MITLLYNNIYFMLINKIYEILKKKYQPSILEVNDKYHSKHNNALHLIIKIKSTLLSNENLLKSHREIYKTIGKENMNLIHAISINIL